MSRRQRRARLIAVRQLYGAVCELGLSLFDRAQDQRMGDRKAALMASCSLIATLSSGGASRASPSLLGRIGTAPALSARRRTLRPAGSRP